MEPNLLVIQESWLPDSEVSTVTKCKEI